MFYRRKVILSILELLGGTVEKLQLQKLLFLVSDKMNKPVYEFVPYKYGCYSFSAKADLDAMVKKEIISKIKNDYKVSKKTKYFSSLIPKDQSLVRNIILKYGKMERISLMKHTYVNYPFYATRSVVAEKILSPDSYQKLTKSKSVLNKTTLFTIGYEGISLEKYLVRLIKNNITLLVDVRKNALSMKYGFSKSTLKWVCNNLGIEYLHIPEVGINSNKRQTLNSQDDYDRLFDDYKNSTLANAVEFQYKILDLLENYNRIALTCYEAETCKCHRTHLAEAIAKLPKFKYKLNHL